MYLYILNKDMKDKDKMKAENKEKDALHEDEEKKE